MSTNPLLDTSGLPLFDQIKPEHVTPALDVLLADAEAWEMVTFEEEAAPSPIPFLDHQWVMA